MGRVEQRQIKDRVQTGSGALPASCPKGSYCAEVNLLKNEEEREEKVGGGGSSDRHYF
jgi:hypothetical protein